MHCTSNGQTRCGCLLGRAELTASTRPFSVGVFNMRASNTSSVSLRTYSKTANTERCGQLRSLIHKLHPQFSRNLGQVRKPKYSFYQNVKLNSSAAKLYCGGRAFDLPCNACFLWPCPSHAVPFSWVRCPRKHQRCPTPPDPLSPKNLWRSGHQSNPLLGTVNL